MLSYSFSLGSCSSPVVLFRPASLGGGFVSGARGCGSSAWCLFGGFSSSGSLVLSARSCSWVRSARSARLSLLSAPRPFVVRSLSSLLSLPLGFSRPVVVARVLPFCAGAVLSALRRSGCSVSVAPSVAGSHFSSGCTFAPSSVSARRSVRAWLVRWGVV